jgi:hypothetical protein
MKTPQAELIAEAFSRNAESHANMKRIAEENAEKTPEAIALAAARAAVRELLPEPAGGGERAVKQVIMEKWGGAHGIPKGLRAKERNRQIIEDLCNKGLSEPQDPEKMIQRVLKKMRAK